MFLGSDFITGLFEFFGTVLDSFFTAIPIGWLLVAALVGGFVLILIFSFLGGKQ